MTTTKTTKSTKTAQEKLAVPSNLSFLRSIEPTEGLMFSIAVQDAVAFKGMDSLFSADAKERDSFKKKPVEITTTTVRGTIANDDLAAPSKRVDAGEKSINAANIQQIEQGRLAADAALLLVTTQVRFAGHAGNPCMSNEPAFTASLQEFLRQYAQAGGYRELALRYVLQLASASWIWRNRFGDNLQVRLAVGDMSVVLGEDDLDLSKGFNELAVANAEQRAVINAIADLVAAGIAGGASVTVHAAALVDMGFGAEVYPSQEFGTDATESVEKGNKADKEKLSRVLSKIRNSEDKFVATIHARKVANAVRTIDTWHGQVGVGTIAVEPYGANTHQSVAYRVSGNDLYTYLKSPEQLKASLAADGVQAQHHFVVACLIRGGVYGFKESSKAGKKAQAEAAPVAAAETSAEAA
jgi:CRISPR-associated protein Csy3